MWIVFAISEEAVGAKVGIELRLEAAYHRSRRMLADTPSETD